MNGVTSVTNNVETVQETSDVLSDANGVKINSVVTNLRESINAHHNRNHSNKKHQIILTGDSNIRGYASSLVVAVESVVAVEFRCGLCGTDEK